MKILVVGIGLIGGSICKAISSKTNHTVVGYDTNASVIGQALDCGCITKSADNSDISDCDMTIVCLHPQASADYMQNTMSMFRKGMILIDVCGIKGQMVVDTTNTAEKYGVHYVGTHPMAGKERFGFEFSDGNLFQGSNFIITPVENTDKNAVLEVEQLAKQIGFSNIVKTSPFDHDHIIAYTSQLAHVVSNAYVKSPTMQKESGFSGGSFQDMTRIATLNEDMWSSLFLSNKKCLLEELNTLIDNLIIYRDTIQNEDKDKLTEILREGRILKENNLKIK